MTEDRNRMKSMRRAIALEKRCRPEDDRKPHPKVGVVVVKNGRRLASAYRGEGKWEGSHAEYIALVKKLGDHEDLSGAILYTTLEPCTTRVHPKEPCWKWIVKKKIAKVVIGILDPNPNVCGIGEWILKSHGVVIDHFPPDLQAEIENDNSAFIQEQKKSLFKKISGLVAYRHIRVPCVHCGYQNECKVRVSEQVENPAIDCPNCNRRFFLHIVEDGYFTTRDGGKSYGVSPAEGLGLRNAVRWVLERKQGWIEPEQIKRVLRFMAETESESTKEPRTPNQLMKSMLNSEKVVLYRVTRERIRSFFRFLISAGYFLHTGSRRSRYNLTYTNDYDEKRAVSCYLESCLHRLRNEGVIRTETEAVDVANFLLSETMPAKTTREQIGRETWASLRPISRSS